MLIRRLLVCVLLLVLVAAGLEWYFGQELAHFEAEGGVVPPFGRMTEPERRTQIQAAIAGMERGDPGPAQARFDPAYGWINTPAEYWEGPIQIHINSIGARGEVEYGDAPPPGARRVLCFGDSFTFGTEVADLEAWPALVDEADPELEVINLAVGGWALDQSLLRWREVGPDLDADAVLIGLSLASIGRHVNRYRPLLHPGDTTLTVKPRFRLEGDRLVLVPQPYSSRLDLYRAADAGTLVDEMSVGDYWAGDDPSFSWSNLSILMASRRAHERRKVPPLWLDTEAEPFRVTVALIEALDREVRAAGVEHTALVIFPRKADWKFLLREGWEERVYWRALRDALDSRGIDYIDLFPTLREGLFSELYLKTHLSPRGNRVAAERVRGWLREHLELDQ